MTADWESPDGSVRLFCADNATVTLEDDSFDAVLTDPPYGINHPCNFGERGRDNLAACYSWPDVAGDDEPFDPAHILSLDVPTILWGGNHYASRLPDASGWLVWDKLRPDDLDQATCELAWTNVVKGVRRFKHLWDGFRKDSEREESYHPTQKPVALMDWCLSLPWTRNLEAILDPYMGSGPVGVACVRLGRKFIGIEREEKYFRISVKRIQDAIDSFALFTANPKSVQVQGELEL